MNVEELCKSCFTPREGRSETTPCPVCGYTPEEERSLMALPLGTILAGKYLLGRVLGIGGFGITYLGFDLTLNKRMAIKEYMPQGIALRARNGYDCMPASRSAVASYQKGLLQFLEEARTLASLEDIEAVVRVHSFFHENETAYFVMEYLEGDSLKAYMKKKGGRLSYAEARRLLTPIFEALALLHERGLLHRDVSPDNIYITNRGQSRLLDFGAARVAFAQHTVSVVLKRGYTPSEQYSAHGNQGPWTDVYAAAATLYHCVTGIMPPDALDRHQLDTLQPPEALGLGLSARVGAVLIKALALDPQARYANMRSFMEALDTADTEDQSVRPEKQPHRPKGRTFKQRLRWLVGGVAAVLVLGLATWFLWPLAARNSAATGADARGQWATALTTALPTASATPTLTPSAPATPIPSAPTPVPLAFVHERFLCELAAGEVRITGYDGTEETLVIPDELSGYPVTAIGKKAFQKNETLIRITLPSGIRVIEREAFDSCEQLADINWPEGLERIEKLAFNGCGALSNGALPSTLKEIGALAFSGCKNLEYIALPENLETLGEAAFADCMGLRAINIPDGLEVLSEGLFKRCHGLTRIVLPEGVRGIELFAFYECDKLSVVVLPASLEFIDAYNFDRGQNISIHAPSGSYADSYAQTYGVSFTATSPTYPTKR